MEKTNPSEYAGPNRDSEVRERIADKMSECEIHRMVSHDIRCVACGEVKSVSSVPGFVCSDCNRKLGVV